MKIQETWLLRNATYHAASTAQPLHVVSSQQDILSNVWLVGKSNQEVCDQKIRPEAKQGIEKFFFSLTVPQVIKYLKFLNPTNERNQIHILTVEVFAK